ncbi:restriction endonuclease subunit S [Halomonas sp. H10-9-1]|uniref:restriction endonuclease subunit S n=1 Tax=Halomonas sp. H10-9-1 TaxID=2950871 RepID=UPI0032DE4EA1
MSWATMKLGDAITLKRGHDLPSSQRKEGAVPVVSSSGITGYHTEAKATGPGVVTGRYGTLGEVFYVEGDYWPLNTSLYVCDFKGNSPRYVAYLLRNLLRNFQSEKAAVPGVNRNALHQLEIRMPCVSLQQEIEGVLSCYDDLIDNNQRRIQLLEESARLLYKEWFVHLRFPGHEHVKVTNGVPEGWSRRKLVDVTSKIGSGATPKGGASAYQSEGIALIRSQNVYDYRFDSSGLAFINDEQADRLSNVEVNGSDVLLNITGASVGRCCLAPDYHLPARVNQHVMIIRSDSEKCGPHYLLHFINSYREKQRILASAGAGGSTREALTKSFVQNLKITLPSRTLMEQFEEFSKDCFEQKQKLEMQNIRLAKARDLLLPKLMSGELAA